MRKSEILSYCTNAIPPESTWLIREHVRYEFGGLYRPREPINDLTACRPEDSCFSVGHNGSVGQKRKVKIPQRWARARRNTVGRNSVVKSGRPHPFPAPSFHRHPSRISSHFDLSRPDQDLHTRGTRCRWTSAARFRCQANWPVKEKRWLSPPRVCLADIFSLATLAGGTIEHRPVSQSDGAIA